MGGERSAGTYSFTEIFAIVFVLVDVLIVGVLVFAGPGYALAFTALFVAAGLLAWVLDRGGIPSASGETDGEPDESAASDPVTRLQERYAAGELSESEFEAKLDRVIESNERAREAGVETSDVTLEERE